MPKTKQPPAKKTAAPKKGATPPVKTPPSKRGGEYQVPRNLEIVGSFTTRAPAKAAPPPAVELPPDPPREVIYPEFDVLQFLGDDALTEEKAKQILGWQTEGVTDATAQFTDMDGKKVRCYRNQHNRPFDKTTAKAWCSEVLHGRWRGRNGETMILGTTGETIDAQHRLAGLVFACQEWRKAPDKYPQWETAPTMEAVIVVGVDESDDTVNTINTGRPRSFADVLFRSEFLQNVLKSERANVSRIAAYAVRMLFHRTGAGKDAFLPGRQTHSDAVDFLKRHERLLEAVQWVYAEDKEKKAADRKLKDYIAPGYAAALLYLMGTSASDRQKYADAPGEDQLDFSLWDKAEEFFTSLAGGDKTFGAMRVALGNLLNTADTEGEEATSLGGTPAERCAIVAKAWQAFCDDKPITAAAVTLSYSHGERGMTLAECPSVGGIDLGDPSPDDPPAAAAVPAKPKPAPASEFQVGENVHVAETETEPWDGTIAEMYPGPMGMVFGVRDAKGDNYEVAASLLRKL